MRHARSNREHAFRTWKISLKEKGECKIDEYCFREEQTMPSSQAKSLALNAINKQNGIKFSLLKNCQHREIKYCHRLKRKIGRHGVCPLFCYVNNSPHTDAM